MFEKTRELLESGIENESGFCEFELDNKKREDIQSLLTHLDDLSKKAEYMKKGWEFIEANLLDELVNKREYYIMLRMLKKPELKVLEFTVFADTYEQALSEAVKSLEEGKEAVK